MVQKRLVKVIFIIYRILQNKTKRNNQGWINSTMHKHVSVQTGNKCIHTRSHGWAGHLHLRKSRSLVFKLGHRIALVFWMGNHITWSDGSYSPPSIHIQPHWHMSFTKIKKEKKKEKRTNENETKLLWYGTKCSGMWSVTRNNGRQRDMRKVGVRFLFCRPPFFFLVVSFFAALFCPFSFSFSFSVSSDLCIFLLCVDIDTRIFLSPNFFF
jgi:hypothetical protein